MRKQPLLAIGVSLLSSALAACGGSSASGPCDGVTGTCVAVDAAATETVISAAFVQAAAGSTIAFPAGTFTFKNSLNLASVKGVTIRGAGIGKTILDFSTLVGSGEGIVASATDSLLFQDFTARDTKGNGIKVVGSKGVTWRRVQTIWTNADAHTHGAYGLYPVQSSYVLIENCEVAGAADAGIYVGQSDHIVVRNNDVHNNVAGIEIENSSYSSVHDNKTHDNVGGILIFNMPDLQVNEGGFHHVYNNEIKTNNTVNFAKRGSSVARVPGGTGAFVLAGHDVEFDHNTVSGNQAAAFSVISYPLTGDSRVNGCDGSAPMQYDYCGKMWPAKVWVHDNTFSGNGSHATVATPSDCPDPTSGTAADCPDPVAFQLGLMLASTAVSVTHKTSVSPLIYDGMINPTITTTTYGGTAANLQAICYASNTSDNAAPFVDLQFGITGGQDFSKMTTDLTPFSCTLTSQTMVDADVTAKAP